MKLEEELEKRMLVLIDLIKESIPIEDFLDSGHPALAIRLTRETKLHVLSKRNCSNGDELMLRDLLLNSINKMNEFFKVVVYDGDGDSLLVIYDEMDNWNDHEDELLQ